MSANAVLRGAMLIVCSLASVASAAVTISPATVTLSEGATQQFTASASVTWTANCGTISSTGLFTAALANRTCTVTATPTAGGSAAAANVTIASPITLTPLNVNTPQGGTQQFTASVGVTWIAGCGSITAGGLFTASAAVGSNCSIEATAISGTKYHVYGNAHITAPVSGGPLTVLPTSATVSEGATQQFTASASATWAASCGSISSTGLFTAPLVAGGCMVTATPTAGGSAASATVTVTSPITITPPNANTVQSGTQQFTANSAVTWAASCGTISSGGLFTAPGTSGATCSIMATAASGPAYTATATDTIGSSGAFSISPTTVTLSEGVTQQFTASASATWTANCGTISSTGLFTSALANRTCTVTATPTAGGSAAVANVTITSPISFTPAVANTPQGSTQQFTPSVPVTWSATCGSISASGLYTASAAVGTTCSVEATAASGTKYHFFGDDVITAPNSGGTLTVSPASAAVSEGATQQFTASAGATWAASCGTISSAGLYTAPLTAGSCTVAATATDGSGQMASTVATTTSPITLTPATVNLHALNTQSFTASQAVTWTASCGSISSSGVFTAPISAGSCAVTATASSGTPYTAVATANVDVVNYTAWKGGGGDIGAQTDELVLTPSNVNSSSFGIDWTASVDGWVNAQPLYMNGLMVNGSPHNVVFVVTANDSVYAFDGDTGGQLWQVSLIPSGGTAVAASSVGYTSGPTQIGILGTPVIDPSTNTMYVVSETSEQNATYFPHRLHALDVTTGNEKFGGPVLISNPQMVAMHKLQRPGLTLANGSIYVGIGSMQDRTPYNGLLFAFNAATLAQQNVWVATPTGSEGGIWMGGAGPSVDENGDIYVATGNGTFDGTANYGEAAVKFSPGLQLLDYFAPYNFAALDANDVDLGSGDIMIVPDQTGPYPHELISCGKPSPVYVLNRDNMGHVGTTSDNIIQSLDNQVGVLGSGATVFVACLTAPAMWGQSVYFGGKNDVLKMFTLNASTGMLSSSPMSQDTLVFGYPGADPVVSANGATNGIVWTVDTGTNSLRANNATNVANLLYSSVLAGGAVNWTVPTVVNGHVYVAEKGEVFAFGLQ